MGSSCSPPRERSFSSPTSLNTTDPGLLFHPRRGESGREEGFEAFPEEIHVREDFDRESNKALGLVGEEENGVDPGVERGQDVEVSIADDPAVPGLETEGPQDLGEGGAGRLPQPA